MPYFVRPMGEVDISQVTEIDLEAFPTMWPPPNYERELKTKLAHYLVAGLAPEPNDPAEAHDADYLVGFAGFWMMANEAHITNIAVRNDYYRQGIGELLLIAMIDLAGELSARLLTLEVRTSNLIAQNLYHKYGFSRVGWRRGYYTDNKEDALVMSVADITVPSFQTRLKRLKEAHSRRWGTARYHPLASPP